MIGTDPMDPPGPAECMVVVYRPADRNPRRGYAFHDGMEFCGFLEDEGRIEILCEPGEHIFYVSGTTGAAVLADLEAGRTYYLRVRSRPEFLRLQVVAEPLRASDRDVFAAIEEEMAACRPLKAVPEETDSYETSSWDEVSEPRGSL